MFAALLLGASLLPMQVAVEGDSELSSVVVLRLLDDGYRVVPSADDAMTTLSLEREEGGDVVVIASGRRTASERVLSGTPALVELEVAQRALLLLDEVGGEPDVDTDGLPGGVSVDVRGRGTPLQLAALRDRVVLDLLRRGVTVVRRPRDGDRIACIGFAGDRTSLLLESQLPCPALEITSTRGRLTAQNEVGAAIAKATSFEAPRDRRTRGHPFLGRRRGSSAPTLLARRDIRLGAAIESRLGPVPLPSLGARAELGLPVRKGFSLLVTGTLAAGPRPFMEAELAVGPDAELSIVSPWLSVRAGILVAVGLPVIFESHGRGVGEIHAFMMGSVLVPVTLSWRVVPGVTLDAGAALGMGVVPLLPRASAWVGVSWDGSGNFRPAGT